VSDPGPTPSRALLGLQGLVDPLIAELLAKRLVAILATHEPDGGIHAVAVWYAVDGDAVVLATGARSRKVANLEREPRATLTLHDSRPGYEVCGACLLGRAEVVRPPHAARLAAVVHDRYLEPAASGIPAVRPYLESDDVAIRFVPERAFTWDERESEAARALAESGLAIGLEPTSPRGYGSSAANDLQ
jgi:PPOX class probable F420-dependent enzyme